MEKPPAASTLVPLLKKVQPTIMLSVPLIIEKIYKGQILPKFTQSKVVKMLYSIAPIRKMLNRVAGQKLMETFGGRIRFFGIGGAKLDPIVEKFLMEAKFPIAIGYGLTETAPLLAGTNPQMATFQSTGPAINGVSIRIDNPNPQTGEGEIVCSGPNIMMGYYKDEEQTKAAFTEDGWFKTGDLGIVDKKGFIYIKGRLKNMILGPSGENIYPEEIESVINEYSFVVESLVVEKKGKLVAMVHFNYEELEKQFHHMKEDAIRSFNEKVEKMKAELQDYVNALRYLL
jgi:long-chain acyl-CoA synthetase